MGKTLSEDLRVRVIAAVAGGMSRRTAARRFDIAVSTAVRWMREWIETGSTTARPKGGDLRSHRIEAFGPVILGAIEARVDITLVELAEMLKREHAASFAPSTIWRFLSHHGITIKKPRTPASRTGPTSRHGARRGPKPSRSLILSAWSSSMKPAHRRSEVRHSIKTAGAMLHYLPPYSPDLNPIENAFAKLKAMLRNAAARTIDELWQAIRDALPRFTPAECANYITAAGYKPD